MGRKHQHDIIAALKRLPEALYKDRQESEKALTRAIRKSPLQKVTPSVRKAILGALCERDPTAEICRDKKDDPEPDTELRDTERVPLKEDVDEYFARGVAPHVPDAWINTTKAHRDKLDEKPGKVGYEINFSRYFYTYEPPRPLEQIEADIRVSQARIIAMLEELTG